MVLDSTKGYRDTSLKIAGDELENELWKTNSGKRTLPPCCRVDGERMASRVKTPGSPAASIRARPAAASVPVPVPFPAGESLSGGQCPSCWPRFTMTGQKQNHDQFPCRTTTRRTSMTTACESSRRRFIQQIGWWGCGLSLSGGLSESRGSSPGHFSITADGAAFGADNTWPGLDSWQMAGAYLHLVSAPGICTWYLHLVSAPGICTWYLHLGRQQLVLDYFDFVRACTPGRPHSVRHFSGFDPVGWQMAPRSSEPRGSSSRISRHSAKAQQSPASRRDNGWDCSSTGSRRRIRSAFWDRSAIC